MVCSALRLERTSLMDRSSDSVIWPKSVWQQSFLSGWRRISRRKCYGLAHRATLEQKIAVAESHPTVVANARNCTVAPNQER